MIKLESFYELVSKNAQVTLVGSKTRKTYFKGSLKDIPDEYDGSIVEDFSMNDSGYLTFKIKVTAPADPEQKLWREGAMRVYDETFHYWAKVYDEGSEYGIDGGRVSKLTMKRDGKVVCNYDRGWDIKPVDENTKLAMDIVLHGFAG